MKNKTTYLGSKGASGSCFIDNLHRDRNTKKASFCNIWGKRIVCRAALFGSTESSETTDSAWLDSVSLFGRSLTEPWKLTSNWSLGWSGLFSSLAASWSTLLSSVPFSVITPLLSPDPSITTNQYKLKEEIQIQQCFKR